jgi:hypothetical protein
MVKFRQVPQAFVGTAWRPGAVSEVEKHTSTSFEVSDPAEVWGKSKMLLLQVTFIPHQQNMPNNTANLPQYSIRPTMLPQKLSDNTRTTRSYAARILGIFS